MEYIFIVKILIFINFSLMKIVDMRSQGEFLEQENKGKLICNSPNDIISGNFISEKLMKILTIKIYYIFSKNDPPVSHTKNHVRC